MARRTTCRWATAVLTALAVLGLPALPGAAAPTWLPQTHLSTGTAPESFEPQVVTDRFGNATAAWYASADGKLGVFVAGHPAGGMWASPVRVSDPARDAYF